MRPALLVILAACALAAAALFAQGGSPERTAPSDPVAAPDLRVDADPRTAGVPIGRVTEAAGGGGGVELAPRAEPSPAEPSCLSGTRASLERIVLLRPFDPRHRAARESLAQLRASGARRLVCGETSIELAGR